MYNIITGTKGRIASSFGKAGKKFRFISGVIGVALMLALMFFAMNARPQLTKSITKPVQQHSAVANKPASATANHNTTGNTDIAKSPVSSAQSASIATSSVACRLLPLSSAQTILGPKTTAIAASVTQSATADTQVSACAYSNSETATSAQETIELIARTAKTPLGVSANIVAFGSGKPSGVSELLNYGQAAFWNPNTGVLSVLKDNNWYDISHHKGNLPLSSDVNSVAPIAQLIMQGL